MTAPTITNVEFRPLVIPERLDAPDAGDYLTMVEIRSQVLRETTGHDLYLKTAEELLPYFQPDPDEDSVRWLVVVDGRPVGRVLIDFPLEEDSKVAYWAIELIREFHGRGIGSRAYELVEKTIREYGRTILQSFAEHPEAEGERIQPPTGFGSIPANDPAARFYTKHGYTLEQVARTSILDLTTGFDRVEQLFEQAKAKAEAAGYRLVNWFLPTPPEFVAGYGWLHSRMSTDAPSGDLVWEEEVWDADRVARHDERILAGGHQLRVSAVQHIATGELAAFTELVIGADRTRPTDQHATLVLKEHRGHSLGLLVKCENLLAWRELVPESPRVITDNAEENRPMLDINEAIGFVPFAYDGGWKKVLAD